MDKKKNRINIHQESSISEQLKDMVRILANSTEKVYMNDSKFDPFDNKTVLYQGNEMLNGLVIDELKRRALARTKNGGGLEQPK